VLTSEVQYGDTGCTQGTDTNCNYAQATVTIESWVVKQANG
jgi:hypothetical protein